MQLHYDSPIQIDKVNTRDNQEYEKLFHKYYATLCFFVVKYVKDDEIAKDIVQDVFINFYEQNTHFENETALKSYLYVCVRNKAINQLEKNKVRLLTSLKMEQEPYTENEFLHHQIEAEILEEIFAAIELLPTDCRNIFKMSYIEHMEISKIAELLHISPATIKTQRQRAKKFLRAHLQNLYPVLILFFF